MNKTKENNDTYESLERIAAFPVGSPFATKVGEGPVRYGWVIGYAMNLSGELVFKVRWAHRDKEQLLHPMMVYPVTAFHIGVEEK